MEEDGVQRDGLVGFRVCIDSSWYVPDNSSILKQQQIV